MHGVSFELDARVLKDDIGIERSYAYTEIERALESIGYAHMQYCTYVYRGAEISDAGLYIDTYKVLNDIEWFGKAVSKFVTFEVSSWNDIADRFK